MSQADAPGVSAGWRAKLLGGEPQAPDLDGHARLIVHPAYRRLLRVEPLFRRSIPVLIVVFLIVVGLARVSSLTDLARETDIAARDNLNLIATALEAQVAQADRDGMFLSGTPAQELLDNALPIGATGEGRVVVMMDPLQRIIATAPENPALIDRALTDILPGSQPLTVFGARAGVQILTLPDESEVYAAVHLVNAGVDGSVAVFQPRSSVLASWRREVTINAVLFMGTGAILTVMVYAFFAQASRAREADHLYAQSSSRFDTALLRGRCGLWDWDLARGRLFWSPSMYQLLGMEDSAGLMGFGEMRALVHPDDPDLYVLAKDLLESGPASIDHAFRMRHTKGHWVWLRARAEIVHDRDRVPHLIGIAVDVTEQRHLAEKSATADARLRDAIETISEAFVLWDSDNRLVLCNSKYQSLHELPNSLVHPGTPYAAVMASARLPTIRSEIKIEDPATDGSRSFEAQLDDGRWLQISERRTKDGGFVSVGTDITELKRHEEKLLESERRLLQSVLDLKQSRQKLQTQTQQLVELAEKYQEEKSRAEAANTAKSEFLASMSHELRTPLNAIIGFSEIMQSGVFGTIGDRYVQYCRDIHDSGTYLLNVISDILDMSKIEAGRVSLTVESVHLAEVVNECIRIMSGQAADKNIAVDVTIASSLAMLADRRSMKQIVLNLLSNALKFTPSEGRVSMTARQDEDDIVLTVADTGIGIPKDAIDRLGQPFVQVENQLTRKHAGSGLGLAIARSLSQMHGGHMTIASTEGVGTTVTIRLPRIPGDPVRIAAE